MNCGSTERFLIWMLNGDAVTIDPSLEWTDSELMDQVARYARFRLGNHDDAQDVATETWLAVRGRVLPSGAERRLYVLGVARNKIADMQRRRRWLPWLWARKAIWTDGDLDGVLDVGRILGVLSEEHREVLALKYFHELSAEEIGAVLGRTPTAVNSLLQRARKAYAKASGEGECYE